MKPISENDLQAYVDARLDVGRRAEVEAYLARHPDTAERIAAYRRHNEMLHALLDPTLNEPIPEGMLPRHTRTAPMLLSRPWRYAAVLGWLLLGGIGGWTLHATHAAAGRDLSVRLAQPAAIAHAVYAAEVRHPVEVGVGQEAHLVSWLSKRLGQPLHTPNLTALGYQLIGGRLLPADNGPAAQFMYQDQRGRRLTLYVRTDKKDERETAFRFAQEDGISVFYWVDHSLGYALSGEINRAALLRVANAVYQQLNP